MGQGQPLGQGLVSIFDHSFRKETLKLAPSMYQLNDIEYSIDEWILITNVRLRYQALVQKELDRAYDDGTHPDAKNLNRDLVERAEEAERMREHIVKEMDKNKDRMISKDEFLERVQLLSTLE